MTTCGTCVCPTPTPTLQVGDLCTPINATDAICHIGFNTHRMTVMDAMLVGAVSMLALIAFIFVIYKLFYEEYEPPKVKKP